MLELLSSFGVVLRIVFGCLRAPQRQRTFNGGRVVFIPRTRYLRVSSSLEPANEQPYKQRICIEKAIFYHSFVITVQPFKQLLTTAMKYRIKTTGTTTL